jgi:predicted MPP superfamily phosphohydrolase
MLRLPVVPALLSELAERWNSPQRLAKNWARRRRRQQGIEVRRFAGPRSYVGTLDHLRIAHLTDLHVGRVTPYEVQKEAVALTNAEKPDLIAITGDFVCHSQLYLDQLAELIASFEAPVVAVLGNHDHWSGAEEVRRALVRAGAEVLSNHHTTLTLRHQKLQIVGLDDSYTGHADREKACKGLRADLPTLGLSHIAEEADGLWARHVPLVLAGHTHGGQVTLARLHELALGVIAGHKYVHGLYGTRGKAGAHPLSSVHRAGRSGSGRTPLHGVPAEAGTASAHQLAHASTHHGRAGADGGAVYVGAGIGAAIVPLRLGERGRREVTIFELGHEPGAFEEHHTEQAPLRGRKPTSEKTARRAAAVARKKKRRERRALGGGS